MRAWFRKYWKYLIFPLWLLFCILLWVLSGGRRRLFPRSGIGDEAAERALMQKDKALAELREKDAALAQKVEKKLQSASEAQVKEFLELKSRGVDEVARWIDGIQ